LRDFYLFLHRNAAKAAEEVGGHKFSAHFLFGEWTEVIDAWQLKSCEAYRDVSRLGRKTRIGGKQREILWSIFERLHAGLAEHNVVTWAEIFGRVTRDLGTDTQRSFDYAVVDEAQDLGVAEAVPGRLGRRTAGRPRLHRGSRPADFPAAIFVEGAWPRYSRPILHAADQLPHIASDPDALADCGATHVKRANSLL
jgi:hypothetical protein